MAQNTMIKSKSTRTHQQRAYAFVKNQIMNLDLKPGQYITDSEVAGGLGISRTPVREALRRLQQAGLLVDQARRGWKVYSLTLEDIHEIFDIKAAIETMIVRKAARYQDQALRKKLQATLQQMQESAANGDFDAWQGADVQLHHIISEMGGNDRAAHIIQSLNDQWHRLRVGFVAMTGRIERSNPEHEAIVEHILAGEGEKAAQQMRLHLNNVRDELVRLLVNLVLPFAEEGV